MMRVLHLIDAANRQACPTTLALLHDALGRIDGCEQQVLLLGGATLRQTVKAVGVEGATLSGVPFGSAVAGYFTARRAVARLGHFDLAHCWSVSALTLATMTMRQTPKLLTLTLEPSPGTVRWLRTLTEHSPTITLLPVSNTIRRTLLSGGVAESCVHVLRPAIDMGRIAHGQRESLREGWGVDEDRDRVIALLSDPPAASDAIAGMFAVSLVGETFISEGPSAPRPRLLVHPDAARRLRAQNAMHGIERPWRVVTEPRLARPWEVLPGCDVALAQGAGAGGLSLLWAMAANVPIVGEAVYAVAEVVEDHHSALLAKPGLPKLLAHRLRQLFDDPQLAWRLRDAARHEAFSFFSRQRFCQNLTTVYRQVVAGESVRVPPLESTGGLRFAARA